MATQTQTQRGALTYTSSRRLGRQLDQSELRGAWALNRTSHGMRSRAR
jgi:hypothetical protein